MSTETHPRVADINARIKAGGELTDTDSDFLELIGDGLSPEEAHQRQLDARVEPLRHGLTVITDEHGNIVPAKGEIRVTPRPSMRVLGMDINIRDSAMYRNLKHLYPKGAPLKTEREFARHSARRKRGPGRGQRSVVKCTPSMYLYVQMLRKFRMSQEIQHGY